MASWTARQSESTPVISACRNLYDPVMVRSMGIEYLAIGR
jgi:hypothetical protein